MNRTTGIVRFNLLTILAGLAVQTGVEAVVERPTPVSVMTAVAFFLVVVNFYHGKIATTEAVAHQGQLLRRPELELADYALNIMVVGTFVFMPYFLDQPHMFLVVNMVMRVLDGFLVAITAFAIHGIVAGPERRAQLHWLAFDAASGLIYVGLLVGSLAGLFPDVAVASVILAVAVVDIVLDYAMNWKFYFPRGGPAAV